ncbi:hypothetical protein JOB18_035258 [Solea senegalensis]|uniref:Uncharacterized protein n=1 Tax=Solea senegalensis TaxID=28829 RepID=A0AAV6SND2_SOLSE|nr:hypothetical protein JOB18_035258 [Solea senegalensis]
MAAALVQRHVPLNETFSCSLHRSRDSGVWRYLAAELKAACTLASSISSQIKSDPLQSQQTREPNLRPNKRKEEMFIAKYCGHVGSRHVTSVPPRCLLASGYIRSSCHLIDCVLFIIILSSSFVAGDILLMQIML